MRILAMAAVAAILASEASATVAFYNDKTAFDAATSGTSFVVDSFSNSIAQGNPITFDSGVVSTMIGGIQAFDNFVSGDKFNIAISGSGSSGPLSNLWDFPAPVTAVGFSYFGINTDGVSLSVDGSVRAIRESADSDPENGFFGFTTTVPVSSILFDSFSPIALDVYDIDNLQFGLAAVPVPAALPLLLGALTALGFAARRRPRA